MSDYLPPCGNKVALNFQDAPYVPARGNKVALEFAPDTAPSETQYVFPRTHDSAVFGLHSVELWKRYLWPSGWASGRVGAPRIPVIQPGGFGAMGVGYPHIWNLVQTARVQQGIQALAFGQHKIINRNRSLYPGGVHQAQYGTLTIFLADRYLVQTGAKDFAAIGASTWISHFLRYVDLLGKHWDSQRFGAHWASHSPRYLEIDSRFDFPPAISLLHTVGGSRYIYPEGREMTQWGTRIIPREQFVQPQGLQPPIMPNHSTQMWLRYLGPSGFIVRTNAQRFGDFTIWNLTQYVRHEQVPQDGLNPQNPGPNTLVLHRNRTITPVGTRMDRFGYQSIRNGARAVLAAGTTFSQYSEQHSVTYWPYQYALPPGWDSGRIREWHYLWNAADAITGVGAGDTAAFDKPLVFDPARTYKRIGNIDSFESGQNMVAFAIRTVAQDPFYVIQPPYNAGHVVWHYTRWLQAGETPDTLRIGEHQAAPPPTRTVKTRAGDYHAYQWIGTAKIRNWNFEARGAGGRVQTEWGTAFVRNEREFYRLQGFDSMTFGQIIWAGDPTRWLLHRGETMLAIYPGPVVTVIGGRPPDQRVVVQEGIEPTPSLQNQVPPPKLNYQFILADGFDSQRFGNVDAANQGARVEPGIGEVPISLNHRVELLRRYIVGAGSIPRSTGYGQPRFSPNYIYAPSGQQAPPNYLPNAAGWQHVVDGRLSPAKGVATPGISFRYRRVSPHGLPPVDSTPQTTNPGRPLVELSRRYIKTDGFNAVRFGWPTVPGPQPVDQNRSGWDSMALGAGNVGFPPYIGPRYLEPKGLSSLAAGTHEVDFFHRTRSAQGFDSVQMGTSRWGDTPYLWQGLRIGPYVPNIISGGDQAGYSDEHWVSHWRRSLVPLGFDTVEIQGYSPESFAGRLRIRRQELPPPAVHNVLLYGIAPPFIFGHGTRSLRHYILPDGDADQYRKSGGARPPGVYDIGGEDFSDVGQSTVAHL